MGGLEAALEHGRGWEGEALKSARSGARRREGRRTVAC